MQKYKEKRWAWFGISFSSFFERTIRNLSIKNQHSCSFSLVEHKKSANVAQNRKNIFIFISAHMKYIFIASLKFWWLDSLTSRNAVDHKTERSLDKSFSVSFRTWHPILPESWDFRIFDPLGEAVTSFILIADLKVRVFSKAGVPIRSFLGSYDSYDPTGSPPGGDHFSNFSKNGDRRQSPSHD